MQAAIDSASIPPWRWIERNANARPDGLALVHGELRLSHGAVWQRLRAIARQLAKLGVTRGDVVAIASRDALRVALLAHALPLAGGALLPLDPAAPRERHARLLALAGCARLFADAPCTLPGVTTHDARLLDPSPPTPTPRFALPEGEGNSIQPLDEDDIQLIVATSGSEGEAKGVMLTGRNLAVAALASRARLGLEAGDRWLACLPLHHIGGIAILHRCAQAGAAVMLMDRFDADAVARALHDEDISHVSLAPAMLARLIESKATPPATLKRALIGGGRLSQAIEDQARARGWPLCVSYGLSEAGSQVATRCKASSEGDVGLPLPGMEVDIDPASGRIRLRGEAVMAGYANSRRERGLGLSSRSPGRPKIDLAPPGLARPCGRAGGTPTPDGGFESGDLGRLDEAGRLWMLGRADDMLVTGGVNVHPLEVEARLAECPGVTEAAISARPDPVWGDLLVAVVAGEIAPDALHAWCRAHLPGPMRPRVLVSVERLPRTALGKLDRRALRTLAVQSASSQQS
jgi:O-succinylbenzoic acid--CoA ligase